MRPHRPPCRSGSPTGRASCGADVSGRGVESRRPKGAHCQGHYLITPIENPPSPPVTKASDQPPVTTTEKTARPQTSQPKSTAIPKPTASKSKKKGAASVETAAAKPTSPNLVIPNQISTSPLAAISDLDYHPLHACVELTRRLLISISFLPTEADRPLAGLKTVILLVSEYGSTAQ